MTGDHYPDDSPPLTVMPVKSALELGWGARLPVRPVRLTGRQRGLGWAQWEFDWSPTGSGDHELLVRATDTAGRTQPMDVPYNDGGYLFWAVVRHPVTVG